jgi:putative chitinase
LGNTHPGDGLRYYGRGFIQITGRYNYTEASKDLGIDLVTHPELVEKNKDIAAKVSVWFWKNRVRPHVKNFNDTAAVTYYINKALHGLKDRTQYFKDYKIAMNATTNA